MKRLAKPKRLQKPMCLELLQRDFLDVIDDPMEFGEPSLAAALSLFIREEQLTGAGARLLWGVINALDNPLSDWKLTLSRRGKGKRFVPINEYMERIAHDADVAILVCEREASGIKKEAAVAEAIAQFGLSRAAVFEAMRRSAQRTAESDARLAILNRLEESPATSEGK